MEMHFYESKMIYPQGKDILHDWESVRDALENKVSEIHTTQMCELSTSWILDGYRLFVHQGNGIVYEITLQTKDNRGSKTVRISQNVYAMWASNVFRE